MAELTPADRPAQAGDTIVVDLVREDGQAQRDYVVELGAGRLVPELEQQLIGMSAGETREIRFESGDDARTRTLVREMDEMMRRRGASLDTYLQVTGGSAEELVARLHNEAKRSVAGELVLEAAADELEIEISDEQVEQAIRERFEEPEKVIEQLRAGGAFEQERESLRMQAALDRLAADVKRIPVEQAQAREAIWTPDKEKSPTETKLWTPGSKEPA